MKKFTEPKFIPLICSHCLKETHIAFGIPPLCYDCKDLRPKLDGLLPLGKTFDISHITEGANDDTGTCFKDCSDRGTQITD